MQGRQQRVCFNCWLLPADERGAPGQAANAFQQQQIPFLDAAILDRGVERQGIEAAEVLACLSTVTTTRSGGRPSLRPVPSMMRLLAWRHQPVDVLGLQPGLLQDLAHHCRHVDHGVLENLLALHAQEAGRLGRGRAAIDVEDVVLAAVGMQRIGEDAAIGRGALAFLGLEHDDGAAPSPNTQVPRSFQSRMREKVSAPITSAVEAMPFLIRLSATDTP